MSVRETKMRRICRKGLVLLLISLAFFAIGGVAYAAGTASPLALSGIADNIKNNFASLAKLITAAAYVSGFGFAFAAILKFKAHKDNPTQIPIGTPIALIFIGAALIFLPTLFGVAGQTVFGSGSETGGVSGTSDVPGFS